MYLDLIVQIVAAVLWLGAEAYLIRRDSAHGKGRTEIDRRTRNFNTIATVMALTLAPPLSWIVVLRFGSFGVSVVFWIGTIVMAVGFMGAVAGDTVTAKPRGRFSTVTFEVPKGCTPFQW